MADEGVHILGGGCVPGEKDGQGVLVPYVHLRRIDGSEFTVFPELLAALTNRALFRESGSALLSYLRLKALEWRREQGIAHHRFAFALADTVSLSCLATSWASRANKTLDEAGFVSTLVSA